MAERLSDEDARGFAEEAYTYVTQQGGSFNRRPQFVAGFARELGMDVHSADTAFKAMEKSYAEGLLTLGYRFHL